MEGGFVGGGGGGGPGDSSRPPIPAVGSYRRQCFGGDRKPTLVRHASLVSFCRLPPLLFLFLFSAES